MKFISYLGVEIARGREVGGVRGVFRTQPNMYDERFLRKLLTAKSRELFSQKISIVDV